MNAMCKSLRFSLLLFFCFSLFLTAAHAQDNLGSDEQEQKFRMRIRLRAIDPFKGTPPPPGTITVLGRSVVKSVAGGAGNVEPFFSAIKNEKIRNDLGLSGEQVAKIRSIQGELQTQMLLKGGRYMARFKKMTEADHEALEKELTGEIEAITNKLKSVVTEEQLQKSRTLIFQATGGVDSPLSGLDSLATLNLSEEQKAKAGEVYAKMEKERLALMEEGIKLAEKAAALGGVKMSDEDAERMLKEAEMFEAKVYASGRKIGEAIRPILTAEQRDLAVRLVANRPSYLPPLPKGLRMQLGDQGYRPGEDAWQPGQGVPEEYRKKEEEDDRRRFPSAG